MKRERSTGRFHLRRADRTRRRILDTALRVFSSSGYDDASMDDIAIELEATKGLLYHYFRSKQELLSAILREHPLRTGIKSLEQGVQAGSLPEALSAVASWSLHTMQENRAFIRFLLFQAQSSREQADAVFHEVLDRWTSAFESIIHQHLPPNSRFAAPLLARQIADMILASFIRNELGGQRTDDLDDYVQEAVETVISRVKIGEFTQSTATKGGGSGRPIS